MSAGKESKARAQGAEAESKLLSLDDIVQATAALPQTEKNRAQDMVETAVTAAMEGTIKFDKNPTRTLKQGIQAIDAQISKQLAAVMHNDKFQNLEGTWRGLHHLVMASNTGPMMKIKLLNAPKKDLAKDLDNAVEFDQSLLFKKVYTEEFGTPGGEPYGALIGDYQFGVHPDDIDFLTKVSGVAAGAFCPFISAASPDLFGLKSFTDLSTPRDLATKFDAIEYTQWNSYRQKEDSRFVTLVMPRVLSRLPYGANTKPISEFDFEEVELDKKGKAKPVPHEDYAWMNAAYVMGVRLTEAFDETGFCTRIRGMENGGRVGDLPAHIFTSMDGDSKMKCPTEILIPDRREKELSDLGFLPLCHWKNSDCSVFIGAQTTQKPKKYGTVKPADEAATKNAAISARLPYIMAVSRIAHFLKAIARDKIGSYKERADMEKFLNGWIADYVSADPTASAEVRASYPLRAAEITVQEVPGAPGSYNAVCKLQPWLQLEELTTSLQLVASLPKKA
ncbi:MAG: type VI secretion system contractile sheath large subunit [Candidatus Nealsonbacteria bacterium]|nr:type VI secretion system contractile sheath large subunit [Candidatus Nealsonbacteria bacterium]